MRRVVLVGGDGFLGRHARAALERRAGELALISVDCRPPPSDAGEWRQMDVLAEPAAALVGLIREARPDAVVNCAGGLAGDTATLVALNVLLVARLLDAIAEAAPGTRLVHLGSAAEYGRTRGTGAVTEDQPTEPVSAYGVTKLAATQLMGRSHAAGAVEAIVLRVFNPVGAGLSRHTVLGHAAVLMRRASLDGDPSIELGDLSAVRDFVSASDVGELLARACICPRPDEVVFNVGSGVATPVREMVRALAAVAGYDGDLRERAAGSPRSGAVAGNAADVRRARRAFDWTPSSDPTPALRALWDATRS